VPSKSVTLNSKELIFRTAKVDEMDIDLSQNLGPDDEDRVTFNFSELPAGSHTLKIEYDGIINDSLHGFYKSTYKDAEGIDRYFAMTQYESTDARRALPCFDEPCYKATFDVTITTDSPFCLSNMNTKSVTKDENNKDVYQFER